ncbi:LysE family transporter [bacterium]|nr:LysE family transporter [bacterium]
MHSLILIAAAFTTGFAAAIPAGPVQIEVVKRSLNGHIWSSLMVILGAMLVDVGYGTVAFFGIAPYLQDKEVMSIFWLIGAVILLFLSVLTIKQSRSSAPIKKDSRYLRKKRWGLAGGISLSLTNPMMIFWWLIAAKLLADVKIIETLTTKTTLIFLAAGGLGLASYLVALSLFIFWAKKFISEDRIKHINLTFGILLFVIALYFLYSSFNGLIA